MKDHMTCLSRKGKREVSITREPRPHLTLRQTWRPSPVRLMHLVTERLPTRGRGHRRGRAGQRRRFFELEAHFPRTAGDVPSAVVEYVAEQVRVPAARFADYWEAARAIKRHRVEIRDVFGFREATRADEETLTAWLAEEVCPVELAPDELVDAVLVRCRALRVEPPGRIERIVGSARSRFEQRFCGQTVARLGPQCAARLEALVEEASAALPGQGLLAQLKADPGRVGLETLLREIDKLAAVRELELPAGLFGGCSEKLVDAWRVAGGAVVSVGSARVAGADPADAAWRVVLAAPERDHRRARRPADRPGAQDQRDARSGAWRGR